MNFNRAFELLIGNEGKFTRDPADRGNWTSGKVGVGELKGTKYGISAMSYPKLNIINITLDEAKTIYKRDFWDKINGENLPEAIRFDMFDAAVNMGVGTACRILQETVGTTPDGNIGNVTLACIATMNPETLDKRLAANRLLHLCQIPTWPSYGKGWVSRVANNLLKD